MTLARDLLERLNKADEQLTKLAAAMPHMDVERVRLMGKREGVRLAVSYVEEALRGDRG